MAMASNNSNSPMRLNWWTPAKPSLASRFVANVLKVGPIPRHVSFILDGNRTYARLHGLDERDGHKLGIENIVNVVDWCLSYGIEELSLYIFSIENIKRHPSKVLGLFELAGEFARSLADQRESLDQRGISVRSMGDWGCVPPHLLPVMAKAMWESKANASLQINIAFMYTGRNEITRGVQEIWRAVNEQRLSVDDVTVPLLDQVISISSTTRPVDLLVRTSGCTRISDFMMWQSTEALLHFVPELWPDFNAWSFHKAILFYQRQKMAMQKLRLPAPAVFDPDTASKQAQDFLADARSHFWGMIETKAADFKESDYIDPEK